MSRISINNNFKLYYKVCNLLNNKDKFIYWDNTETITNAIYEKVKYNSISV